MSETYIEVHCEYGGSLTPNRLLAEKKRTFFLPMNGLLQKFNSFKELNNFTFEYILENGDHVSFKISQYNFPHLIGLQKLIDIPTIVDFNDSTKKNVRSKYICSLIKKEKILTEETIKASNHFSTIEKRYELFNKYNLTTLMFKNVIVDFDKTLLHTKLNSDYIFFDSLDNGYLHLGISKIKDKNLYIPETFIYQTNNYYIRNQKILKVVKRNVYDENNNLISTSED